MKERFEGEKGHPRLIEALGRQPVVGGDMALAAEIAARVELLQFAEGELLIRQGHEDDHMVFLIVGSVDVLVNGRVVADRHAEECLGEMAVLDPTSLRSATVVATETVVAALIGEAEVTVIASRFPDVWRRMALVISRRLRQRSRFLAAPNERPRVFVGSSTEMLATARAVEGGLEHDECDVVVWTAGVFHEGGVTVDDLLLEAGRCDLAILVLGPDDVIELRGERKLTPRDNVVFELGLFMGQLGRGRALMLKARGAELHVPSDLLGITPVEFDGDESHGELAVRLGPAVNQIRRAIHSLGAR